MNSCQALETSKMLPLMVFNTDFFAGYWDVVDLLARDPVAAQELLQIFTDPTGSWQERANDLTAMKIYKYPARFFGLTELANSCDTAALLLDTVPGLRAAEPVASAVIEGWFNGGKDYLRQRFPPFGQVASLKC